MSKYFTNKRGEITWVQEELNTSNLNKKKEAVKRVIAYMTVGKDVSSLFMDMLKCMETPNMELKKLVQLQLINQAKNNPDQIVLAVNTFQKDARDRTNPLLRALAIRTMGCIRVQSTTEQLCDPLKDAINDEDPYVRKTAALSVAKLQEISPTIAEEYGFIDLLKGLLTDGNSMVVSNTVSALNEISITSGKPMLELSQSQVSKLITALNECSEWGQATILDALAKQIPTEKNEAETLIERIIPRLSHNNPAVVLSTIRVCIILLDQIENPDTVRSTCRKLAPPMITMLSSEPEMQQIILRNITIIVQKRNNILEKEIKVFFCKYNDPIYCKMEKLEIIINLTDNTNIDQVLHELKDYATEIDVDFVRKSVRAIGRIAVKLERAAEKCVTVLLELIRSKINYVIQESIIVIKDIFRKYPNRYELIIKDICENLVVLDEPEAKASMIWIIGEYAERIDKPHDFLSSFIDTFLDEPLNVQLQILTATVKLQLKFPDENEGALTHVLKMSTEDTTDPSLRDRGQIQWRLLSYDPDITKKIVFSEKVTINTDSQVIPQELLDILVNNIGTLSAVQHKQPESFISKLRNIPQAEDDEDEDANEDDIYSDSNVEVTKSVDNYSGLNLLDIDSNNPTQMKDNDISSLNIIDNENEQKNKPSADLFDLLGDISQIPVKPDIIRQVPLQKVVDKQIPGSKNNKSGLTIETAFQNENNTIIFELKITNQSNEELTSEFAIQFNVNSFGLDSNAQVMMPNIAPGSFSSCKIKCHLNPTKCNNQAPSCPFKVQIALRTSLDDYQFEVPCMLNILLITRTVNDVEYQEQANKYQQSNHIINKINFNMDKCIEKIKNNGFTLMKKVDNMQNNNKFASFQSETQNGMKVLCSIEMTPQQAVNIIGRSEHISVVPLILQAINFLLTTNY